MAFIFATIRLGLANLRLHVLRSVLTALGIIFGVMAVIAMVSIGEGSKREALLQIERLGALNIVMRSTKPPESVQAQGGQGMQWISRYGITREDLRLLAETFPDASAIVPVKAIGTQVFRGDRRLTSQAFGTTPELIEAARLRLARGRYLTIDDMEEARKVAVIGAKAAATLFPFDDPLGETVRVDDQTFTVVGVLAPVGLAVGAGGALIGRDLDQDLHVPMTAARAVFGDFVFRRESGSFQASEVQVSEVYLVAPSRDRVLIDADRAERVMSVNHPELLDVSMHVPYQLLEQAQKAALQWTVVFGAVAGISLVVGGIGIMNIMLATVTERTREIGIRRALGARRDHIVWQFLVETGVLSAIGGLAGVVIGIGFSVLLGVVVPTLPDLPLLGRYFPEDTALPTRVTPWSVAVAFVVATLTGVIFGIYPARKAAHQDPIVALRHE